MLYSNESESQLAGGLGADHGRLGRKTRFITNTRSNLGAQSLSLCPRHLFD